MTKKPVYYVGAPDKCDICEGPFDNIMYDAATRDGPWANMCVSCFERNGRGTGTGVGQQYTKQGDGRWLKTEG